MKIIAEPKDLISNENNGFTACWAGVCGCTSCNRDVLFRGIVRGKWCNSTILASKFKQPPVRSSANSVRMVVNFIIANITWSGGWRRYLSGASTSRTGYYRHGSASSTSSLVSGGIRVRVVVVCSTTEATAILRTALCNFGDNRVPSGCCVIIRIVVVIVRRGNAAGISIG